VLTPIQSTHFDISTVHTGKDKKKKTNRKQIMKTTQISPLKEEKETEDRNMGDKEKQKC